MRASGPFPSPKPAVAEHRVLRNVVLCGFMGAGKSTVARLVAEGHGFLFVDTDERVERSAGCSVAQVFARDGEAAFRRLERDAVAAAARLEGAVIATGGGAILDAGSRSSLARTGLLVYLEAPLSVLIRRLGALDGRPLAAQGGADGLTELFERRRPVYERLDVCVSTAGRSPGAVADAVVESFLRCGGLLPLPPLRGSMRDHGR